MRIKLILITALVSTGFLLLNCASPVVNLGSARINKRHNLSAYSQPRKIEHHSNYKGAEDWRGDPYDRTANAYGINYSYGVLKKNWGIEYGIKIGTWQHFHWHYRDGSSTDYFPYVWIDTEGAEVIRLNPYLKFGINQQKPLKVAFVAELPAGGVIVSYDLWKLTPYLSGRLSLTKYENPVGYHWRSGISRDGSPINYYEPEEEKNKFAFLPSLGIDIRLTDETIITLEGGIIRDYYKKDNLYVTGISFTFH